MYTFKALQILIFLIPGFISTAMLSVLIVRKEQKELGKIVEALIFSLLIYTIYSFVGSFVNILDNILYSLFLVHACIEYHIY